MFLNSIKLPAASGSQKTVRSVGLVPSILAITLAAGLSACESGGSSGNDQSGSNATPVITSGDTIALDENTTGVIYTLTATDADGDALTYGKASSLDSNDFTINATTGALSFVATPDFENPTDGDLNNVYKVALTARDSKNAVGTVTLTITVNDLVEPAQTRRLSDGFTNPLYAEGMPGTDYLAVVEKAGLIRIMNKDTGVVETANLLDLTADVSTTGEKGLLGMAFAPGFTTNRTLFVNLTNTAGDTEIRSYTMQSGSSTVADPASENLVMTIAQPAANHNGGWIGFDADGLMLIPTGDGGGAGDPNNLAQDVTSLLGKILRINIAADDFTSDDTKDYAIPDTNPFATSGGAPEIWAVGLRNPFRNGVDTETNTLYIGDVGQDTAEEISRIDLTETSASADPINFGWPVKEGTQDYKGTTTATLVTPVIEYLHADASAPGTSVTGGYVYRGSVDALKNRYVFSDFTTGKIWSVPVASLTDGSTAGLSALTNEATLFTPDLGTITSVSSFGQDEDGNLYVVDYAGGSVFVVEPKP